MNKENITTKELEEIYRKLVRLYERFSTDMLTIGKQGEVLGQIIEELKAESSLATEFKVQVREGIKESVDKAVEDVNTQIRDSVQQLVTKEVSEKIKEFKSFTDDATKLLTEYVVDKKSRGIWVYLIVFFCGLILIFTGYTYMRINKCTPDSRLTADQVSTYRHGVVCETMWNKLSKKTQDRLMLIEKGKLPPEESSYEWLENKYPKMSAKEIHKKFDEQKE